MEISFNKEAQDKLISGINKLAEAVGSTMGPNGNTVVIPDNEAKEYGKYKVTKDGVSVAESIYFKCPVENIGAQLIKQAAQKTVKEAGDGTTTSTVLASAFINNLKDFNSVEINKAFDEIIPKVIEELRANSKILKQEDIKYVASISANNDLKIGDLIQEAYNHSNTIKVEEGNDTEDKLELIEGMQLPVSYLSKAFVNQPKLGNCEFDNPYVIIIDGKLDNMQGLENVITTLVSKNESILIIVEHVNDNILRSMESQTLSGNINLCVMKSPGFSKHRQDLLRDIADLTGATVINDLSKNYNLSIVGRLKSCTIGKNNSILVKHEDVNIDEFVDNLKELSKSKELTDYDKELVLQRLEKLTGKVSIIRVGGKTENEMKERKDRYDDAVLAVACALEEGIVEGAGNALKYASYIIGELIKENTWSEIKVCILDSLRAPQEKIKDNGCIFEEWIYLITNYPSMFERNIVDPLKVTRCALENAVSVAKTVLSTKAVVLNRNEWN